MTRTTAALASVGAGAVLALAGCSSADPAAVAAVGLDDDGYAAVEMMCDQGRTLTQARFEAADGSGPALSWIGRTVEPITFYRIDADPPDNWVSDIDGGLLSDVSYTFVTDDDAGLEIVGPEFTLADLNALGIGEVIAADGTIATTDDFLAGACG